MVSRFIEDAVIFESDDAILNGLFHDMPIGKENAGIPERPVEQGVLKIISYLGN